MKNRLKILFICFLLIFIIINNKKSVKKRKLESNILKLSMKNLKILPKIDKNIEVLWLNSNPDLFINKNINFTFNKIYKLKKLKVLILNTNNIKRLPKLPKTLNKLWLGYNPELFTKKNIKHTGKRLKNLENLEYLDLLDNNLTTLPDLPITIKILYLSHHNIPIKILDDYKNKNQNVIIK